MKKLFCISLMILALTGCEYEGPIYPKHIDDANAVCQVNGGLDWMYLTPDTVRITCKNGATFSRPKTL